ncbi:MAG: prenyltransferase/squalene oxidase repeat-containing protein [Planctomycetota bacterium]|jgi:hypothetical protein
MVVRFLPILLLFWVAASAAPQPKNPRKDPKFWKRVDASIDQGVDWLLAQQRVTGHWTAFEGDRGAVYELGMQALCLLACTKGGVPQDDPRMKKGWRALESIYETQKNNLHTYDVGVVLMLLDAKVSTKPRKRHGKLPKGAKKKRSLTGAERARVKDLAIWLALKQKPQGMWRYPDGGVDLSNTQYAALGLWSAHRVGVEFDKGVVRRMMEAVLKRQQPKGVKVPYYSDPEGTLRRRQKGESKSSTMIDARGWRYAPPERIKKGGKVADRVFPYSGSMTTAGIAVLAIGRDILGKHDSWLAPKDASVRRAMWEGMAWLHNNWDVHDNPGQNANWVFYYLYGLERAGQLSNVDYMGLHDWFAEGAIRIMDDQRPDGSWPLRPKRMRPGTGDKRWESDQLDTAFAILFLTRSTPRIKTPAPTITGGD